MSIWREAFQGRQLPPRSIDADPAEPARTITVSFDTEIDRVVWEYYGHLQGTVERVLEANPGLADRGALVPAGAQVLMPRIPDLDRRRLPAPRAW